VGAGVGLTGDVFGEAFSWDWIGTSWGGCTLGESEDEVTTLLEGEFGLLAREEGPFEIGSVLG
jgi:hypothetical protein